MAMLDDAATDLPQTMAALQRELDRRTAERDEALAQQAATSEILSVISRSPIDVQPVFEAIVGSAGRVCEAEFSAVARFENGLFHLVAIHSMSPEETAAFHSLFPRPPARNFVIGRAFLDGRPVHFEDVLTEPDYDTRSREVLQSVARYRSLLGVPILREGRPIGVIFCGRREVKPFTATQIKLLETFADQAAIAIENVRLFGELETRNRDVSEALEQQTATAEVLQVINSSPGDLSPVFDAMLDKATRLCEASFGTLWTYDGESMHAAAIRGAPPRYAEFLRQGPHEPSPIAHQPLLRGEQIVHIADIAAHAGYRSAMPLPHAVVELGGVRTLLAVPLRKEEQLLGVFSIYRQEVRPFSDKQLALLQNFAAQAVIAMENARLLTETREALEQQTATAEILQVINSSPGDLAPVFDAILEKAHTLCGAASGALLTYDGEFFQAVAWHDLPEPFLDVVRQPFRHHPDNPMRRLVRGEGSVQVCDLTEAAPQFHREDRVGHAAAELGQFRTNLMVPLRKDGGLVGVITANRWEARPFSDKQIALLENFAAQAVIAMENARLLTETREALEQQTATAEVLGVINSSPGDLAPVFDAILEKAHSLCDIAQGSLELYDGERFRGVAVRGLSDAFADMLRQGYPASDNPATRPLIEGSRFTYIRDLAETEYSITRTAVDTEAVRSLLCIPLRRDHVLLGMIASARREVRPFSDKEIVVLENFAAQAVIAIENARLLGELRERTDDLTESLEYQTATSDVLKVISRSTFDLQPVLDTLVETAARLCAADGAGMAMRKGEVYRYVSLYASYAIDEYSAMLRQRAFAPGRDTTIGRVALEGELVHIADIAADPEYALPESLTIGKIRTNLGVPLLRDGTLLGMLTVYRQEVRPFSDKQIALLQTFADQAVIAVENTRLFTEQQEALEQQTATAEVLGVINSSPGDLGPVFHAILEKAHTLCGATLGSLFLFDGELFRAAATHGYPEDLAERLRQGVILSATTQLLDDSVRWVHNPDLTLLDAPTARAVSGRGGVRTNLMLPLRKDARLLGAISCNRQEVRLYSDKEIALLENFATQAVIAIENARLLGELRERTEDLQESLEYQTATSDVLKAISRSTFDLQPILDTLVETATRLCDAEGSSIATRDGEVYRVVADFPVRPEWDALVRTHSFQPGRNTITGRVLLERQAVQIADITADPEYDLPEAARVANIRTLLGVPLLREGEPIGVIRLSRTRVEPFTERQIELVRTFADQAVIAIENTRLFGELQARTDELAQRQAELRVTFDNMADGVVMFDEELRLAAWNRNFQEIIDLPDDFLAASQTYSDYIRYLAGRGEFGAGADPEAELRRYSENAHRHYSFERARPDGRVIEVRHNPVPSGGFVLIYSDITERKRSEAEIRAARDAAEEASRTIAAAYQELKTAQARLIQAEKMASLGQLTAGIAHEIKNPLNFVNNFAGLSVELLDELKETAAPAIAGLAEDERADVDEIVAMLTGNLEKIAEHGRRADGIVKSMLEHSRGGSGERRAVDLNGLVEEALNLAYHGARAQDQSFNITLERDFADAIAPIELVPQDVTRVCLNLFGNGFYAATKRQKEGADPAFKPTLTASTHDVGEAVEIRIRDNGAGIPPEIRDKLFQPFFTTKPTGEGTGLGLSISWDIVTQQHGGAIEVDSRVGEFTEFTIRLPRADRRAPRRTETRVPAGSTPISR
jgi:GAF domain-containing protein/signal transduction histidine kinase